MAVMMSANSSQYIDHLWLLTLTRFAFEASDTFIHSVAQLPDTSVNWDYVATEAMRHRVGPVVLAGLRELGLTSRLSQPVLERLTRRTEQFTNRWWIAKDEFNVLTTALHKAGISSAVLRGFAIAVLYRQAEWRHFRDFDLLVHPSDIAQLDRLLRHLGYVQGNVDDVSGEIIPMTEKDRSLEQLENRLHAYLKFIPDRSDVFIIEPHIHIFSAYEPYCLPAHILLQGLDLGESASSDLLTAEMNILESSMHIYRHGLSLLSMRMGTDLLLYRWLDLAVLLQKFGHLINWSRLFAVVLQYNLQFPASFALYFLHQLYNINVPGLDTIYPDDFEHQCQLVWHFDRSGNYSPVTQWKVDIIQRLFDRSRYAEMRDWGQTAQLDETKVRQPDVWRYL